MLSPLVTVSVSSFNNARFIIETLDSIYDQTYGPIELIIVDDASEDNSVQVINQWLEGHARRFTRISMVINEQNLGVCKAANLLIRDAHGKYISLIGSDDLMMPDKIRIQAGILEHTEEDVAGVYSDAYLIKEDSSSRFNTFIARVKDFEHVPSGFIFEDLIAWNYIPAMTMLMKASVYKDMGGFDEGLAFEDYDMWLRIARKYRLIFSDYMSVRYRIHQASITGRTRNWNMMMIPMYAKHLDYPSDIVIKRVREIAQQTYYRNDKESYKALMAANVKDNYVSRVLYLMKLKVPFPVGNRMLGPLEKK